MGVSRRRAVLVNIVYGEGEDVLLVVDVDVVQVLIRLNGQGPIFPPVQHVAVGALIGIGRYLSAIGGRVGFPKLRLHHVVQIVVHIVVVGIGAVVEGNCLAVIIERQALRHIADHRVAGDSFRFLGDSGVEGLAGYGLVTINALGRSFLIIVHGVINIGVGLPHGVQDVAASAVDTGRHACKEGGAVAFRRGVPAREIIAVLRADADVTRRRHRNHTIILERIDRRFRARAAIGVIGHGDGSLNRHIVCRQGDVAGLQHDNRARIVLVAGGIRPVGKHLARGGGEVAVGNACFSVGAVFGAVDHVSAGALAGLVGQLVGRADELGLDGDIAVQRLVDIYGISIAINPFQQGQIFSRDICKRILVNIRAGNGRALRKSLIYVTETIFSCDLDGDSDSDRRLNPVGVQDLVACRHGVRVKIELCRRIRNLVRCNFIPALE